MLLHYQLLPKFPFGMNVYLPPLNNQSLGRISTTIYFTHPILLQELHMQVGMWVLPINTRWYNQLVLILICHFLYTQFTGS